jgi:hypothetical protein
MSADLSQLERELVRILSDHRLISEISVRDAARKLKKSPAWVRSNLPVIIHGPKSHHIRVADVLAYQERRMLRPEGTT